MFAVVNTLMPYVWPRGRRLSRPPGGRNSGLGAPACVSSFRENRDCRVYVSSCYFRRRVAVRPLLVRPLAVRCSGCRVQMRQSGMRLHAGVVLAASTILRRFGVRGRPARSLSAPLGTTFGSPALSRCSLASCSYVVTFSRGSQGRSEDHSAGCHRHHYFPPGAPGFLSVGKTPSRHVASAPQRCPGRRRASPSLLSRASRRPWG